MTADSPSPIYNVVYIDGDRIRRLTELSIEREDDHFLHFVCRRTGFRIILNKSIVQRMEPWSSSQWERELIEDKRRGERR